MKPEKRLPDERITRHSGQLLGCLRGASLFSNLSDEEIACFNDAAHTKSYKKDKILYLQEEPAEFFLYYL